MSVLQQFPRIIAWASSMFYSFVCVDGRPYLSVSTTFWSTHCGSQFCPFLADNYRWISALFISLDTKTLLDAAFLVLRLWWNSHLYTILTQHKQTTVEPHSQHVTVRLITTAVKGLNSVANQRMKNIPIFTLLCKSLSCYQCKWRSVICKINKSIMFIGDFVLLLVLPRRMSPCTCTHTCSIFRWLKTGGRNRITRDVQSDNIMFLTWMFIANRATKHWL